MKRLVIGGLAATGVALGIVATVPAQATPGYGTDDDNLYTTAACADIAAGDTVSQTVWLLVNNGYITQERATRIVGEAVKEDCKDWAPGSPPPPMVGR